MVLRSAFLASVLCAALAVPASASSILGASPAMGYNPAVPVSAFARPAAWLDPSRLHFSTSVAVGSAFGTTQGLQVTSMRYDFGAPLSMSVSMGNAWGPSSAGRNGSPFLEGLNVTYRPLRSLFINVEYRDIRSPLQLERSGLLPGTASEYEYR